LRPGSLEFINEVKNHKKSYLTTIQAKEELFKRKLTIKLAEATQK
jgi:tRNA splicing endonuclease